MEKKKQTYKILIVVAIVIPVLLGVSYAYFLAAVKYNSATNVTGTATSTFDINLVTESDGYINATNMIPTATADIAANAEIGEFSVTTGNNAHYVTYNLTLTEMVISSNLQVDDFKWDLICTNDNSKNQSGTFASQSGTTMVLKNGIQIGANTTDNYQLRIYVLENDTNQIALMNGNFSAKVAMEGAMNYNPIP